MRKKKNKFKIAVFIIAYQAAQTLISAYKRIPYSIKRQASEIYCFDDCSDDNTYYAGLGYKMVNNIKNFKLYKNPKNLGYGGNQKRGYRYAIQKKFDIVVMLHGDAQYAPEKMPLLLEVFNSTDQEKIGVVMGSRILGDPLGGGMPIYKYIGNRILTWLENMILGTHLSEFHSGYRAYNLRALQEIPFNKCSNDFHFDTEIIIMLLNAGYKIAEVPIPTFYGHGSKSYVNVVKYGIDCIKSVIEYRLYQLGMKKHSKFNFIVTNKSRYEFKDDKYSSHSIVSNWIKEFKCNKVLDLGCAGGLLAKALKSDWRGDIIGLEKDKSSVDSPDLKTYKSVVWADLEKDDLVQLVGDVQFDVVVAADILEHLKRPERTVEKIYKQMSGRGLFIISVPNAGYLPVRLIRSFFPKYRMNRGPLDRSHTRFFTLKTARELLSKNKFNVLEMKVTPPPLPLISKSFSNKRILNYIYRICIFLANAFPNYFSYQIVFIAKPVWK